MTESVSTLHGASWPASELGAALRALVRRTGLLPEPAQLSAATAVPDDGYKSWMLEASARLGVEAVSVSSTCGELEHVLRRLGPSLLLLPGADASSASEDRFLVVLRGGSFGISVLSPQGQVRRLSRELVRQALVGDVLAAEEDAIQAVVADLELQTAVLAQGLRAFALERLRDRPVLACWLVRSLPAGSVRVHARAAHVALLLALIVVARALSTMLSMLLWWIVGRDVLGGGLDRTALGSFALCLLSVIPLRLLDGWAQSRLALDVSATLKTALLYGVLNLERGATRGHGIGQFLSMALEGEQSSAAMDTALQMLVSIVELLAAVLVLGAGAGGAVHVLLLLCWLGFLAWLCRDYARKALRWIVASRTVTHDLVERLVGYQTRLMQERQEDRHLEEDTLLCEYLEATRALDRRGLLLDGIVSYGWLLLGMMALLPVLLSGNGIGPSMAAAVGGILMSAGSLRRLVQGVKDLVSVWTSWQQTVPILQAGRRALSEATIGPGGAGSPGGAEPALRGQALELPLLRFDDVTLRYAPDAPVALRGCSQMIRTGDRVLLEGPSGGGKSTLAMVLSGLCVPDTGAVLLHGESSRYLSPARWRARVVLVPQFHDNHILTESLLFNLLLGRRWPAARDDERAAAAVCDMLGLGPLLTAMPQGLSQTVGDGGWALSHGERSRVFLARALLQAQVEVLILDESFAALDPETLRQSCHGVLTSAPTLLVIAHP